MISEYIISFFKSPTGYDHYNTENIVKDMQEVRASIKAMRAEMNDWYIAVNNINSSLKRASNVSSEAKKQAKDKKRGKK